MPDIILWHGTDREFDRLRCCGPEGAIWASRDRDVAEDYAVGEMSRGGGYPAVIGMRVDTDGFRELSGIPSEVGVNPLDGTPGAIIECHGIVEFAIYDPSRIMHQERIGMA